MGKSSENEGKAWGHGQFANMPQEVVRKTYPKSKMHKDPAMDDTMTGIDNVCSRSEMKANRFLSNQK